MATTHPLDTPARPLRPRGEEGFILIEVIISALLVALIVMGVLTGFDVTNRATADERTRGAATALAQKVQEQLRGEPITALNELTSAPRTQTVTVNRTVFTVTSRAEYINDATATASCTSAAAQADYLQTTTKVTWPSLGTRPAVAASSIVSPPPGTALLVQVTDASANPVSSATVSATGTSSAIGFTSALGCTTLQVLPGEYAIEASKAGYVTPNWVTSTKSDPTSIHSAYLTAETTTKVPFKLAPASTLNVTFTSGAEVVTGDSFVAFNAGMAQPLPSGTVGTYTNTVTSGSRVYPFTSKYEVYAGSCAEDSPHAVEPALKPGEILVPTGGSVTTSVAEPSINIKVMSGYNSANAGSAVNGASGYLIDKGCTTKRAFTTTATGALPHPAMPFGTYELCVASNARYWIGEVLNNSATGPTSTTWPNGGVSGGVATIYLGYSPSGAPAGVKAGVCP
jgi:Tfp pilus assembly protein PilV